MAAEFCVDAKSTVGHLRKSNLYACEALLRSRASGDIETAGAVERFDVDAPGLRQAVAVRFPVTLAKLRLMHDSVANTLASSFATPDGLTGNLDLRWGAAGLDIKRLTVRDAESNATLSLRLKEREFDMAFAGNLRSATLKALLPDKHYVPGFYTWGLHGPRADGPAGTLDPKRSARIGARGGIWPR